jgi:hypothetical protein
LVATNGQTVCRSRDHDEPEEDTVAHLIGAEASAGLSSDGICADRKFVTLDLVRDADGTITIPAEAYALSDMPEESDGSCVASFDGQMIEAEGRLCTGLEVIEPFPVE